MVSALGRIPQIRPLEVETRKGDRNSRRWLMVYQAPGESPLPLCDPTHATSLSARRDPDAQAWARLIEEQGHVALEELRTQVKARLAQEKAEKAAAKAAAALARELEEKAQGSRA